MKQDLEIQYYDNEYIRTHSLEDVVNLLEELRNCQPFNLREYNYQIKYGNVILESKLGIEENYRRAIGMSRSDYLKRRKELRNKSLDGYEEIKIPENTKFDEAINILIEANKNNKKAYINFETIRLFSDDINLDLAYMDISGITYGEWQDYTNQVKEIYGEPNKDNSSTYKMEELKYPSNASFDQIIEMLMEAVQKHKEVYAIIDGLKYYSDGITWDSAYIERYGETKRQHNGGINELEERKPVRKEKSEIIINYKNGAHPFQEAMILLDNLSNLESLQHNYSLEYDSVVLNTDFLDQWRYGIQGMQFGLPKRSSFISTRDKATTRNKDGFEEIILPETASLDTVITTLLEQKKNGKNCYINFEHTRFFSDDEALIPDRINSSLNYAYIRVTGYPKDEWKKVGLGDNYSPEAIRIARKEEWIQLNFPEDLNFDSIAAELINYRKSGKNAFTIIDGLRYDTNQTVNELYMERFNLSYEVYQKKAELEKEMQLQAKIKENSSYFTEAINNGDIYNAYAYYKKLNFDLASNILELIKENPNAIKLFNIINTTIGKNANSNLSNDEIALLDMVFELINAIKTHSITDYLNKYSILLNRQDPIMEKVLVTIIKNSSSEEIEELKEAFNPNNKKM